MRLARELTTAKVRGQGSNYLLGNCRRAHASCVYVYVRTFAQASDLQYIGCGFFYCSFYVSSFLAEESGKLTSIAVPNKLVYAPNRDSDPNVALWASGRRTCE